MKRLIEQSDVVAAHSSAVEAVEQFEQVCDDFSDIREHDVKVKRLQKAMQSAETPEQLETAMAKLSQWDNPAAVAASKRAGAICCNAASAARPAVMELLNVAESACNRLLTEAKELEAELSEEHEAKVETTLARTAQAELGWIASQRRTIEMPSYVARAEKGLFRGVLQRLG